jgi:hypothetical protein
MDGINNNADSAANNLGPSQPGAGLPVEVSCVKIYSARLNDFHCGDIIFVPENVALTFEKVY